MVFRSVRCLLFSIPFVAASFADDGIVREPLRTEVIIDGGQIVNTNYAQVFNGEMLQSTSVNLSQTVNASDRLSFVVGIGGLFYYSIPDVHGLAYQNVIKFATIVNEAMGTAKLGAVDDPIGHLRFGLIPFKYNSDAKNLGEFLLRDEAYPTIMVSGIGAGGAPSIINSAKVFIEGVDLDLHTGPVTHDFVAYTERGIEPTGDITPAYIVSYKPSSAIELGAGVSFAHLISLKPSQTTPNGPLPGTPPSGQPLNRYKNDTVVTDPNDSGYSNYTFKSTKLMARASINFQTLLKSELLGPEDLKLYTEAAILGVKDYPYYYNDIWNRIPVMVGFNLPTFKLLDVFSVEVEYLKNAFPNDAFYSYEFNALPVPGIIPTGGTYADLLKSYDKNSVSNRDFKWSVYMKRSLIPGLTLYAQVASDYLRGENANVGPGALVPLQEPLIATPSDWYYLIRLDMGI